MGWSPEVKTKVYYSLYFVGVMLVILSRVTSLVDYNVAMTIASVILAITFVIDAIESMKQKKWLKVVIYSVLAIMILILLGIIKINNL